MIICPSISPKSMDNAIAILQNSLIDDIVEIRIDRIPDLNLKRLLRTPRPEVIITNRRKDEGGYFTGTALEQLEILSEAIKLGADYVDVEFSWGSNIVGEIISRTGKTKVICSYHNYKETPHDLKKVYNAIRKINPDIIKIATMANDISDNKLIFNLLQFAKQYHQPTIAFCMGELGQISRILTGFYSGYLSFASLSDKDITAPGQLSIEEMTTVFNANNIDKKTKIFGLIGNPVKHSQGIYYHNDSFKRKKVNAVYVNFLVTNLKHFMKSFRDEFSGFSVTMPFKSEIVNYIDKIDDCAAHLNAVNTIINRRNKLIGYNTDFMAISSILEKQISVRNKNVVVLGTGAISKTMAYAAILNGANVTIVGRSISKAKIIGDQLGCQAITFDKLLLLNANVLMNGTSIGMKGTKKIRLVPLKFYQKDMTIFDAVYNPVTTSLLHDALASGCKIITGKELFEKQAMLQSNLFMELFK
jgi:3-dehydroquinate dehydratase / shikimate dehydrogenase